MRRVVLIVAIVVGLLAAPVIAQELNTYMATGDVHWVWCVDSDNYIDGRLLIYPIVDGAVKIECVEELPERLTFTTYFPVVFGGQYAP